jgi:hypothetical protein
MEHQRGGSTTDPVLERASPAMPAGLLERSGQFGQFDFASRSGEYTAKRGCHES